MIFYFLKQSFFMLTEGEIRDCLALIKAVELYMCVCLVHLWEVLNNGDRRSQSEHMQLDNSTIYSKQYIL